MATLNQASIIGFLGSDPKINTTKAGKKMASFSVATTEPGFTKADGTQIPERTEWHNIVLWGKTAEVAERYLHKGSSVFVQGKMRTRSYEDKQGQKRYITEVEAEVMQMLDRPTNNAQQPQQPPFGMPPAGENNDDLPF